MMAASLTAHILSNTFVLKNGRTDKTGNLESLCNIVYIIDNIVCQRSREGRKIIGERLPA